MYILSAKCLLSEQFALKIHSLWQSADFPAREFRLNVIRNYLPDMLWAYALVFVLFRIFDNNAADIGKVFWISLSFSTAMELLQLTSGVKGTFDVWDLVAMLLAEMFAVFIINKYYLGGCSNEKEI